MSNTPNRATNPAGKPRKKDIALDLTTARQMLPLVQSIVSDIVTTRQAIARLTPEQARLERHRRELVWLERQRRYQLSDEIAAAEKTLQRGDRAERAGCQPHRREAGEVDFPTKIAAGRPRFPGGGAFWAIGTTKAKNSDPSGDWDQGTPLPVRLRGQGQP